MTSKKILIFGVSGFLGSKLKKYFSSQKVLTPTHEELDLLNAKKVYQFIEKSKPNAIIYSAGVTKINFAQKHKLLTNKINNTIPKYLSSFAAKSNIHFIYISTDAVFDGYKNKYLFSETDIPKAKSNYGISKLMGESAVLTNNSSNTIIRLITLYGIDYTHPNFLTQSLIQLQNNKPVLGIIDQVQNPLFVEIAAEGIAYVTNHELPGIYHLGAADQISNYNFLVSFTRKFNFKESLIHKTTFSEFFGENTEFRKKNSVLLCDKFNNLSHKKILQSNQTSLLHLHKKYSKSFTE